MPQPGPATPPRRFALSRWFGALSLALIVSIAAAGTWLLSWMVTERMLWQEATLTRDFVSSLLLVEKPLQDYFVDPGSEPPPDVEEFFEHIARMPDVLRANIYDRQRQVMWSSDRQITGRRFGPNEELDLALTGAVVVEKKTRDERLNGKAEYEALTQPEDLFVEIYVPVVSSVDGRVLGAIEFYKNPRGLLRVLQTLRRSIALGAAAFAALLFGVLFGIVRRADLLLRRQERQLVENETFAVVGEMSTVVAHGIRNPLAAIRSSAELIVDAAPSEPHTARAARDIIDQSDRLGAWLRELLGYTRHAAEPSSPLALPPLVRSCLQELAREFERRHIGATARLDDDLPAARGDALAVGQILRSVLANALDAVPDGGRIAVTASVEAGRGEVSLHVEDNGPGLSRDEVERVGKPFFTTKPQGMGVGLALARRVLERGGGRLRIDSAPGRGTTVTITMRVA